MGLDLALGVLVLIVAVRGWLKGFLAQSIRIGGLVASVYAAAPLREQVRPYVAPQLPSLRPELLDRMMWWVLAVASYLVIVGVASLIVAVARRPTFGVSEVSRGDQFAGFGLGVVKGLVLASFVVAGLHKYAAPQVARIAWAEQQRKDSYAWKWNEDYHPAARIWAAPPVQSFVNHVQRMGLMSPPKPDSGGAPAAPPVQTASRVPRLALPAAPAPGVVDGVDTSGLDPEMTETVESILGRLRALRALDN